MRVAFFVLAALLFPFGLSQTASGSDAKARRLIAEIKEAFKGVGRKGGISWSESTVIDSGGTPGQRAAARLKDKERGWLGLVGDAKWNPDLGIGGWSVLDEIGFRYYLPAGMIRTIQEGYGESLAFHLTLPEGDSAKNRVLKQWSLLSAKQKLCVRHFVQYMVALDASKGVPRSDWQVAFKSYWVNVR